MRFVCDEMLARVGRWLRIAGYDTVWCERGAPDDDVLALAREGGRILLSADRQLVARCAPDVRALHVPSARLAVCVPLLERELGVDWQLAPWSRCIQCNVPIISHEGARPAHAPLDKALFACPSCGKVFWEGAHATRFSDRLRALRDAAE
jgi:uncharacterized protein with PIN domain